MGGWGHLGFIPADGNSLRPVEPVSRYRAPQPRGSLPGAPGSGDSPRISAEQGLHGPGCPGLGGPRAQAEPERSGGPGGTGSPLPPWTSSSTITHRPTARSPLNGVSPAGTWPLGDGHRVPSAGCAGGEPCLAVTQGNDPPRPLSVWSPSTSGVQPSPRAPRGLRTGPGSSMGLHTPKRDHHLLSVGAGLLPPVQRSPTAPLPPDDEGGESRDAAIEGDASEPFPPGQCPAVGAAMGERDQAEQHSPRCLEAGGFSPRHPPVLGKPVPTRARPTLELPRPRGRHTAGE